MLGLVLGEEDIPQACSLGAPSSPFHPCSYNTENYIYLAGFPKEQSIKYLVNSFHGDVAIVTETEEVGCPVPPPLPLCPHANPRGLPSPSVRVKECGEGMPSRTLWKDSRDSIYS